MKLGRIVLAACLLSLAIGFTACKDGGAETEILQEQITPSSSWNDDNELSILAIGNSFSTDGMQYVWQIAKDLGVEKVTLGNLYIGGCSLELHATNLREDNGAYAYHHTTESSTVAEPWTTVHNYKISTAVQEREWDYISLQQVSGLSGESDTYNEDLTYLQQTVKQMAGEKTKLVWHMTWAYQKDSQHNDFPRYGKDQMTMYNRIVDATKNQILKKDIVDIVIPSGTAIQNARTSYLRDTLTRDGYHLDYNIGRYIASLTWVGRLTGLNLDALTYIPPAITDSHYRGIAIDAAKNALKTPFAVTTSSYAQRPPYDFTGYQKLEIDWIECACYNTRLEETYTQTTSSQFYFATKRFTKAELPIGSLIVVKEGWKYRPEGWVSDDWNDRKSRPEEVVTDLVTVTEEWWGEYTLRAFNVCNVDDFGGSISLVGRGAEVETAFEIYVPQT